MHNGFAKDFDPVLAVHSHDCGQRSDRTFPLFPSRYIFSFFPLIFFAIFAAFFIKLCPTFRRKNIDRESPFFYFFFSNFPCIARDINLDDNVIFCRDIMRDLRFYEYFLRWIRGNVALDLWRRKESTAKKLIRR